MKSIINITIYAPNPHAATDIKHPAQPTEISAAAPPTFESSPVKFVLMPSMPRADRALPLIVMPTMSRTRHWNDSCKASAQTVEGITTNAPHVLLCLDSKIISWYDNSRYYY
jgi:hypothetical protein